MSHQAENTLQNRLGIIAGGGSLPLELLAAAKEAKRPVTLIVFKGQPQPENVASCPHIHKVELGLAQVGKVIKTLKADAVVDVVLAGHMQKPSLFDLKPDLKGLSILKRAASKHDNALLSTVCDVLEEEDFTVKGAHEICSNLLANKGVLSKKKPTAEQLESIRLGMKGALAIGHLDIGQAAIVKDGLVIGLEGVEGTAKLIERCASLRGKKNNGGFLVKAAKPEQDLRVDMPSIGVETIEAIARLNYEGIALLAERTQILQREDVLQSVNKHNLILCAVDEDGAV